MRLNRTVAPPRRSWRRVTSIVTGSLATLVAAGWASGCSVIYDLSTAQCSRDTDCVALGGVFEDLVCVNKLCQEPVLTGCNDNAECIDGEGLGTQPYACINRECVALLTNECPTMLPQADGGNVWLQNLRDPDALILAGTGIIGGTTFFDPILKNYELALMELQTTVTELQGRPVVMLGCKAILDSNDELDRMMTHLADRVKVPGMVAALFADDLQRAFTQKADAANMFMMSPLDSDPTLAALPDRGLIWHVGPGSDVIAQAYAPLLSRTLTHLGLASSTDVRVATVVTSTQRFNTNILDTIQAVPALYGLSFNGKTVTENLNSQHYLGVGIPEGEDVSVAEQVADLLAFQPHVIISAADTQFLRRVLPALEAELRADSSLVKPFYLLSPFNYNDEVINQLLSADSTLRARIAGVNGAGAADTTAYDAYIGRWQIAFPESRDERGLENYYDAAYYLMYAIAGAAPPLTGSNIAGGMSRLLSGRPYSVGPSDLPEAMLALTVGNSTIQLNGTLGAPDFNRDGTRNLPGSVWCIAGPDQWRADVLRYDPGATPEAATLTGTFPTECIPGF